MSALVGYTFQGCTGDVPGIPPGKGRGTRPGIPSPWRDLAHPLPRRDMIPRIHTPYKEPGAMDTPPPEQTPMKTLLPPASLASGNNQETGIF